MFRRVPAKYRRTCGLSLVGQLAIAKTRRKLGLSLGGKVVIFKNSSETRVITCW